MKKIKCQCPTKAKGRLSKIWYSPEEYSGMVHEPNKCKGTNGIKLYQTKEETKSYGCVVVVI